MLKNLDARHYIIVVSWLQKKKSNDFLSYLLTKKVFWRSSYLYFKGKKTTI